MPDLIFANRGAAEAIRTQQQINEGARKLQDEYKQSAKEAAALERAAKRIYDQTRTPQEQMLTRIKTLQEAQKKATDPEQAEKYKEAIGRLQTKMGDLKEATGGVADEAERSGGAFEEALNNKALAAVGAVLASVGSLKELLSDVNQLLDEQAQKRVEGSVGLGQLVQLAGADRSKRDALISATEKTFLEGGFREVNEAANLVFQLDSAGALGQRGFFSALQTVDDAATLAKSTALVRNTLGIRETGNLRALTSKSIAAALPATGVSPSQISEGASLAAESAKKLGLSDEELFAAVSRVSETTGNASVAGTQVNALLTSLLRRGFADREDLRGANFGQLIGAVSSEGLNEAELIEFLGRTEAAKAFGVLRDVRSFGGRVREIQQAQSTDLAGRTIQNALEDDRIAVRRLAQSSAARKELALGDLAVGQAGFQAQRDRFLAERIEAGDSVLGAKFAEKVEGAVEFFTPGSNAEVGQRELDRFQEEQLQLMRKSNETQEEQRELLRETNRKLNEGGLIGGPT